MLVEAYGCSFGLQLKKMLPFLSPVFSATAQSVVGAKSTQFRYGEKSKSREESIVDWWKKLQDVLVYKGDPLLTSGFCREKPLKLQVNLLRSLCLVAHIYWFGKPKTSTYVDDKT